MNATSDFSMESRQRFMEQQLSALGYNQKFTVDTLPLLENIVSDLLQTTDTLKHYKNLSNNCLQACHDLEQFLDAYKKDNAWLVQELNTLHLNTLNEKVAFEKRIAELEERCKSSTKVTESNNVLKTRTKSCSRYAERRSFNPRFEVPKVTTEYKNLKDSVRDKDIEIKQLHAEILRLNNLLSGGRPLETILKDAPCNCDYLLDPKSGYEEFVQHENEKSKEYSRHQRPANVGNRNVFYDTQQPQQKSGIYSEKLKLIEEELVNLKTKYQKLETDAKRTEKGSPEKLSKYQKEITDLKDKCNRLELEKSKLLKELEEVKTSYENTKTTFSKTDKELLQLRRSQQELLAEKSNKDKDFKKYQAEKKHLLNRVQELGIIEKDLTLEISRLCNVNAIHKRHILELENKLLETYQSKGKALLATIKPDIIKRPLERRVTRNKENVVTSSKTTETSESVILTQIREKYKKQIENVRVDQSSRSSNIAEFQSEITNTTEKCGTFIDDIRSLNGKVDALKNMLVEKDQTLANLVAENKRLSVTLAELNAQNAAQDKHNCEHCKLAEKLISEHKEKIIVLEAEKRDLVFRCNESQKVVECNKQHIMQLRSELQSVQMELQHYKTDSNRYSRLEEQTNFTVKSSKAVQIQLEIQLESTKKHLQLVENENESLKSEIHSLRDANLKLQKSVMDLESETDRLSMSLEERSKRTITLEKTLKSKENKISNLEQLVDDQQKQLNSSTSKTESRKITSSLEYLRSQVRNLEKCKEQALTDNRRLQRELSELQKDYAACKSELKKAKKEAAELKVQVHDYIAKVRAAEETLQQKSKERSEMLDHFHALTVEANQLESSKETLEREARSSRGALRNAEARIADLENIVKNKDALIAGFEEQLDELTKTVASLETKLLNLTDQRDRLQAELDSSELLCSRSQRECSPGLQSSNTKLSDELIRLRTENELLKNCLKQEKQNVSTLERVLSETRSEHVGQKTSVAELQEIIRGLKANIKCLQESLETISDRLRRTQNEADEYQKEIIRLKRDLRHFQFECARNAGDHSID